jgi:mRNA-degrading endonuclease RelE of RelBE toxin-antitoxin system
MRPVAFHRHAASYLKRMPADRKAQVLAAIETLKPLSNPGDHPNVKAMQGEWAGTWRLRLGSLRVIFRIAKLPDPIPSGQPEEVIDILLIGPRGDIYQ